MVYCLHLPNFVNASWYKELAWGIEPIRVAERVCSFRWIQNGFRIPFGKSGESFLKKDSLDLKSEESKSRLTDYWATLFQFTRSIIRIQICRKERGKSVFGFTIRNTITFSQPVLQSGCISHNLRLAMFTQKNSFFRQWQEPIQKKNKFIIARTWYLNLWNRPPFATGDQLPNGMKHNSG